MLDPLHPKIFEHGDSVAKNLNYGCGYLDAILINTKYKHSEISYL